MKKIIMITALAAVLAVPTRGLAVDNNTVELKGTTSTGTTTDHDDEDTGNFYMEGGTLAISGYSGKAVKADGTISLTDGTQNFDTSDITETAGISEIVNSKSSNCKYYDLQGRQTDKPQKGICIIRHNGISKKIITNT